MVRMVGSFIFPLAVSSYSRTFFKTFIRYKINSKTKKYKLKIGNLEHNIAGSIREFAIDDFAFPSRCGYLLDWLLLAHTDLGKNMFRYL